jgi:ABC-type multidrug transport system ATPase subunit
VLDRVDLRLEAGTVVAIRGRNGAGKTTLLRIASGLIAPDRGAVRVDGFDPEREGTKFQRRIGLVSAGNSSLYARLKPEDHLEMWARLALVPRERRAAAIERVLDQFALEPLRHQRVDRLSMGQRQRLRLALAFLHEPTVVLLDEPTNSLDEDAVALLGDALDNLKASGGAGIVCLPSGPERAPSADAALVLADGRLEAT